MCFIKEMAAQYTAVIERASVVVAVVIIVTVPHKLQQCGKIL
jgi:hypothetical protein